MNKVYSLYRNGSFSNFVRVSDGPGNTYELTPLTEGERKAVEDGHLAVRGVIEWKG